MAGIQTGLTDAQLLASQLKAHELAGMNSSASEIDNINNTIDYKAILVDGRNLFNVNDSSNVAGYYVNYSTGELAVSASYTATHYIRVFENTNYAISTKHMIAWYDKDFVFISGSSQADTSKIQVSPSEAKYLRCTIQTSLISTFQVEKGGYNTVFAPYKYSYVQNPSKINAKYLDIFNTTKNLFDMYSVNSGFYINPSYGTLLSSATSSYSDYIECSANTSYVLSGGTGSKQLAFYDSNKVFISASQSNPVIKVSPSNAKYILISCLTTELPYVQLEQNTSATSYTENLIFKDKFKGVSVYKDLKYGCLGDSITDQARWQPTVVKNIGLVLVNYGVSGTTFAGAGSTTFAEGTRITAMDSDLSLISVMGGTNDWGASIALGSETSTNINEFYGAVNSVITQLITKYPSKRVFFMGTIYGERKDYTTLGWTNNTTNLLGLTPKDYANAIKKRCEYYNIPYLDMIGNLGWNSINISSFTLNEATMYIHPNTVGGEAIGRLVSNFIEKL